jgi:phosphoribosylformylglycinamidine synthase subunit PurQ / glutaminase
VTEFANAGGLVLGICNGFQVLLEAGLLEGAMLRNRDKYVCEHIDLRVEQTDTPFTMLCTPGQMLHVPIAHGEGNYYAPPDVLDRLERNRQIIFRYVNPQGETTDEANPNGSIHNIAGICNEARNVVGLMPHPERACETLLGSQDGLVIFESVLAAVKSGRTLAARAS